MPSLFNVYKSTTVPSGIFPRTVFDTKPCAAIAVVMLSSITFSHLVVTFPSASTLPHAKSGPVSPQNPRLSSGPRQYTSTPAPPRNSDTIELNPIRDKDGHDHEIPSTLPPLAPAPSLLPRNKRRSTSRPLGRHLGR